MAQYLPGRSVVIHADRTSASEAALLVLLGFGSAFARWRALAHALAAHVAQDTYLPDFFARPSVAACADNLAAFVAAHQLHTHYARLHVMAYILGGMVLLKTLDQAPLPNLATVVFDRSPTQERTARALVGLLPWATRVAAGRVVEDFATTPFPVLAQPGVRVGIMVENGVTPAARVLRRRVLAEGPLAWGAAQFGQPHDDLMFLPLHHDQMYRPAGIARFGPPLAHFCAHGRFPADARRTPYVQNPFTEPLP